MASENEPLLQGEEEFPSDPPPYSLLTGDGNDEVPKPPQVVPNEAPPPYYPRVPILNCKVCQTAINLEGKLHQHVVKCPACHEATPIKDAPRGKKYVRCPCNCLLICKVGSQRIACPRLDCKRIIALVPPPPDMHTSPTTTTTTTVTTSGSPNVYLNRLACGHCGQAFMTNSRNCLVRCPHCRKVSSLGPGYSRNRAIFWFIMGLIFLLAGVGVTIGTYTQASIQGGGIYFVWIGAFVSGLLFFIRAGYYAAIKVSRFQSEEG